MQSLTGREDEQPKFQLPQTLSTYPLVISVPALFPIVKYTYTYTRIYILECSVQNIPN